MDGVPLVRHQPSFINSLVRDGVGASRVKAFQVERDNVCGVSRKQQGLPCKGWHLSGTLHMSVKGRNMEKKLAAKNERMNEKGQNVGDHLGVSCWSQYSK